MAWSDRFFNLFRREKVDAEAQEELQFHFVARLEENLAKGMPPGQARREASRQIGGELLARENARDADLFLWLDTRRDGGGDFVAGDGDRRQYRNLQRPRRDPAACRRRDRPDRRCRHGLAQFRSR